MDEIYIKGLKIFAYHGVNPEETENGQEFEQDITMYADLSKARKRDDLEDTISYADVCLFLTDYLQKNTWKLLEAAVEHTCRALLLRFPLLCGVELELEKPSAPIPLPFDSVSVKVARGWHRCFVALGSNLGDKRAYLDGAVEALRMAPGIRIKQVSTYLVTAPYGGVEQDDFLNGAVELETLYDPQELLDRLHDIEMDAKRERLVHWGPRTLDLDILFYDDLVQDDPTLTLPHPDMQNRDFVLRPMAELAPNFLHPVFHKTIGQLLKELPNNH